MLLFRSEEHIDRWLTSWNLSRGAVLTVEKGWTLAKEWYGPDRRDPAWRRRTLEETEQLFAGLELTGDYWRLR